MKNACSRAVPVLFLFIILRLNGLAVLPPERPRLPELDKRETIPAFDLVSLERQAALDRLRVFLPDVRVDFCQKSGSPKMVCATTGFLTGPNGAGGGAPAGAAAGLLPTDPFLPVKPFINAYRELFGFGPEALDNARVTREFVTEHNGLKTVVWEQQVADVPLFETVLIAHITRKGELVNVSSQFVPDPVAAAALGVPNHPALLAAPDIPARRALVLAVRSIQEELDENQVTPEPPGAEGAGGGPQQRQTFKAPGLKGIAEVKLIWLPLSRDRLRLCWEVIFMSRARGEMFRVVVDVQTGDVLLRRCLTEHLSDATYNVFTSDSPSPFSPGHPSPVASQPPVVSRRRVTLPALDTNASPAGWINDGANETQGNNVDAHRDANNDNQPDLARPQGSPFRVFDFPMDLNSQDPTNYAPGSVAQLFYFCNWMHDRLYQMGFTEAAGNFQSNNFARGGLANDAVQADAQDGGGFNNANMSTPPDGSTPRMQMYLFNGPTPRRDGSFDTEVVLHEYTHGLSNRRVGGGVSLSTLQARGMGEGWSDFYGLALLSEPGDDPDGVYAFGAYIAYLLGPGFQHNYYFGIRRYPYTTDMSKNPLTLKDIDPAQADNCGSGLPFNSIFGACTPLNADEVHNMGEVWCVTLWEARVNLIKKLGFAVGNQLALQLVTDGMNLSPPNPNFLQARDAILQADLVNNGGANRMDLWRAFAKRGMGYSAMSGASTVTAGISEAYDLPDDLRITPIPGFTARGPVGGPFSSGPMIYTLTNAGGSALAWTLVNTSAWLTVLPAEGTLDPGGPAAVVTAQVNATAASLPAGIYPAVIWFTNLNNGVAQSRQVTLRVGQPDHYTELFDTTPNDLAFSSVTFTPDGSVSFYTVCRAPASAFPTDPSGGTRLPLLDDSYAEVTLTGTNTVAIYGTRSNRFFIGSNGYLTMNSGNTTFFPSFNVHFDRPRVSAFFGDLNPGVGGIISWLELSDRAVATYERVPDFNSFLLTNSFQVEMFYDGRIRVTYLSIRTLNSLVGLSAGTGVPLHFEESDFSAYDACFPYKPTFLPASVSKLSNGQFKCVLTGAVDARYEVLISTNLVTWEPLRVLTLTNATAEILDTNTNLVQRFYRARLVMP